MKGVQLHEQSAKAIPNLSPALQIEVILHCHRHWLDAIWFLRDLEEICLVRLAMGMSSRVLAPSEIAPLRHMYVVSRGLVLYGGRVLSTGMAWGDDVLLSDERYFLKYLARAMTYTDVRVLPRAALVSIVNDFPNSAARFRRATILLALRRHITRVATEIRERRQGAQAGSNGEDGAGADAGLAEGSDFLDRIHAAAATVTASQAASVQMAAELEKSLKKTAKQAAREGMVAGIAGDDVEESSKGVPEGFVEEMRDGMASMQSQMRELQASMRVILAATEADRDASRTRARGRAVAGLEI